MTIPYKRGQKYIYTCADDTHPIGENTENASKHMMTKPLPFQRGHKLTEYQRVNNHASEGKKCISTLTKLIQCQTDKHVSQLVFTKPIPCRLAQNMYHNLC
jgi:hypothetical protein